MSDLSIRIRSAAADGKLLESSARNIETMLDRSESKTVADSIRELVECEEWSELNDRFFKTIAFGTGGLRGRSIGKVVTVAERGCPSSIANSPKISPGPSISRIFSRPPSVACVTFTVRPLSILIVAWFATNRLT